MNPALTELLATKATSGAKVLALHLAAHTSPAVKLADDPEPTRPRDCSQALNMPLYEVERAWREVMKLGWMSSPRPDMVLMPADALPRRAIDASVAAPAPPAPKKKAASKKAAKTTPTMETTA